MTRRMVLFEIGKALLLLAELACVAVVGYAVLLMMWFAAHWHIVS